jgi:hypothetical protein
MGGKCSTNGTDEKCTHNFSRNLNGRDHLEGLILEERLVDFNEVMWDGGDGIQVAQDGDNGNEPSGSINGGDFLG